MQVDQSESGLGVAHVKREAVAAWSNRFVTLSPPGPVSGGCTRPFNNADELCWTASSSAACASPPSGKTTYTYDTRGNRTAVTPTTGQAQTLTYDQANRLTIFAAASTTSYGYNGDGLRMCKVASSSTQPCSAVGTVQYLWDVAGSLPLLLKDGTTNYVYGPGGLPVEQVSGSTILWYHHDQLGSTRLVTSSTGVSQATYTYDPYGGFASSSGSITNPFRFAGQYQDFSSAESGYYYLRARYYDPATAQFVSRDPAASLTRQGFSYVEGNPLTSTDARGLWGWPNPSNVWHAVTSAASAVSNGVSQAASSAGTWLDQHPTVRDGIAITAGVIGVGLAVAVLAGAAPILAVGALVLGVVAFTLDAVPCYQGDNLACIGAGLGLVGMLAALPAAVVAFTGIATDSIAYALVAGSSAFGVNFSLAGITVDAVHLAFEACGR